MPHFEGSEIVDD
jgi:hypothetical protein